MARPKRKLERFKGVLPEVPDHPLTPGEQVAYTDLLAQLRRAGHEKHTSVEVLIVASTQKAALEEINEEINNLESKTIHGSQGQIALHPLVKERRQLQNAYLQTLGKLLLTPRSKSTARVKEDDNTGFEAGEDPILKLCQ